MPEATRVLGRADVLWRRVTDGVLIRVRGREPIQLTGSGGRLWDALVDPHSLEDLIAVLATEHNVAADSVRVDIEPVIADLIERGVILER